jgi:hypothetical protein
MVRCGDTDPDSVVETRINEVREEIGAPSDHSGCRRSIVWTFAYRCVECGRWFHRDCIQKHFEAHRTARTLSEELAIAAAAVAAAQRLTQE